MPPCHGLPWVLAQVCILEHYWLYRDRLGESLSDDKRENQDPGQGMELPAKWSRRVLAKLTWSGKGQNTQEVTHVAAVGGLPEYGKHIVALAGEKMPQAQACSLVALTGHSLHLRQRPPTSAGAGTRDHLRLKSLCLFSLTFLISTSPVYFLCLLQVHRFSVDTAHSKPTCKLFMLKLTRRLVVLKPLPYIKAEKHPQITE